MGQTDRAVPALLLLNLTQPDVDARLRAERRGLLILHITTYCVCPFQNLLVWRTNAFSPQPNVDGVVCLYCTLRYIAFAPFGVYWRDSPILFRQGGGCACIVNGAVLLLSPSGFIAQVSFKTVRRALTIPPRILCRRRCCRRALPRKFCKKTACTKSTDGCVASQPITLRGINFSPIHYSARLHAIPAATLVLRTHQGKSIII